MGDIEQNLVRQARLAGNPIPDRIKNKPKLYPGLRIFMDTFWDLEYDRPWLSGMSCVPLPIPWQTIHNYCTAHNFTGALYTDMLYFIRELDSVYTRHITKKINGKSK
jgi:hypothetical protein